MLDVLKSYWYYGNTYCAIECVAGETDIEYLGIRAKKDKQEFVKIEEFSFSSPAEIATFLSSNQHCQLIINTDQVLIKKTKLQERELDMISEAFPGISPQEFYINVYQSKTIGYVSVCRKEVINSILKEFENVKLEVLQVHLGFGSLSPLLSYFNNQELLTKRHVLTVKDSGVISFKENENLAETYTIEDTQIASTHLLALAILFQYGTIESDTKGALASENTSRTTLQKQKNFFRKGVYVAIGVLALILMVNTFLYTSYFSKHQSLKENSFSSEKLKDNYKAALDQVERKEKMVTNILTTGTSKSSYYVNRLAASQPSTIQFSSIIYQPLKRGIQPKKKISYATNTLIVKGVSTDKSDFNNWIALLEAQDWITILTVQGYAQANSKNATFELLINLTADATEN